MKSEIALRQALAVMLAAAFLGPAILADEGMWTFDNPPVKQPQEKYNFTPPQQWLDHLRLSCVGLNDGGSTATQMITVTKIADPALRKTLVEGGQAAVDASTDPLIAMARRIDPIRPEQIKWFEKNVQSVELRAGKELGKARFAVYGKNIYPDATFTLRLSYGRVLGYPMNGTQAPYKTTMYGLYGRAASFDYKAPFNLPKRYVDGKNKLDLVTPFNFVTTNDIIGGNSGSTVVNRNGDIVRPIFDGNIQSLVGDFVYDSYQNRSVAVRTAAMTEALNKLYGAQSLVDELMGQ